MAIHRNSTNQFTKMHVSGLANMSPKTMAAAVLMCTMVVLWGRVLLSGRNGPESAQAEEAALVEQTPVNTAGATQFKAVELPFLQGRNDTLAADFFSVQRWTAFDFNSSGKTANSVQVAADGMDEKRQLANLDTLSKELVLEAVIQSADGSGMQAFIGGKVLKLGQVLTVNRQSHVYDLTVTQIAPQEVILAWRAYSIKLKITESHEQ